MKVLAIIGIISLVLLFISLVIFIGMVLGVYIVLKSISNSPEKFVDLVCDESALKYFDNLKENTIEVGKIISNKYLNTGKKKVHKKLTEGKKNNDSLSKNKKSKNKR